MPCITPGNGTLACGQQGYLASLVYTGDNWCNADYSSTRVMETTCPSVIKHSVVNVMCVNMLYVV